MKISIITVNLNNRFGLENTIRSVTDQTMQPFEWIVVDGASTDGSKEYIESNEKKLTRWISEKDNGVYSAMNKGISMATGEYLLFLNSGDVLYERNTLAKLIASNCKTDYLFGYNIQNEGYRSLKQYVPNIITFYHLYTFTLWHQSMLIRRNIFEKYGYYDEHLKIVADWKQYLLALCLHQCTYTIYKEFISVNDGLGLSNSNKENFSQLQRERNVTIKAYFPAFCDDYKRLHRLQRFTISGIVKLIRSRIIPLLRPKF